MNPALTLDFWGRLLGLLGLEAMALVGLVSLFSRIFRGHALRLVVWQVAVLGLAGLILCEVAGLEAPTLRAPRPAVEPPVRPVQRATLVEALPAEFPLEFGSPEIPVARTVARQEAPPPVQIQLWPPALWIGGAICMMSWSVLARVRFSWRARKFKPVTETSVLRRVKELQETLGFAHEIRLQSHEQLRGPVAFGLWRPTIILPADITDRFSGAQQSAMLAHEIAHLAGRDPLWMALADLAVALWWWHPMAWWARRQLRLHSELVADHASSVIENGPTALAESLVILGRELSGGRARFGGMAVEGGGFRSDLARRVTGLLAVAEVVPTSNGSSGWRWLGRAAAVAVVVGIALGPWPWAEARAFRPAASEIMATTLKAFAGPAGDRLENRAASNPTEKDPVQEARSLIRDGEFRQARELLNRTVPGSAWELESRVLLGRLDHVDPVGPEAGARQDSASAPSRSQLERLVVRGFDAGGASTLGHSLRRLLGAAVLSDADVSDLAGLRFSFVAPASPAGRTSDAPRLSPEPMAVFSEKGFPKESTFLAALDSILAATLSGVRPVYRLEGSGIVIEVPAFTPPLVQRDVRDSAVRMGLAPPKVMLELTGKADVGLNSFTVTGGEIHAISPSWLRPSNSTYVALDNGGASSRPFATRSTGPSVEWSAKALADAKLFLELGQLSESRAKIVQVLKEDPENPAARALLAQVNAAALAAPQADTANPADTQPPNPNPPARTGRERIRSALDSIRLPKFQANAGTAIPEVVQRLADAVRSADPEALGINLIWNETAPAPVIDPTTGIAASNGDEGNARGAVLKEPLSVQPGSTVRQVLEALAAASTRPIEFRVEDYAVVVGRWDPSAPPALYTRRFKTDPRPFLAGVEAGLEGVSAAEDSRAARTNSPAGSVQVRIREVFQLMGIGFPSLRTNSSPSGPNNSPNGDQKALFYNDRTGQLFVRATLEDLDRVEELVQRLNPGRADAGDALAARRDYASVVERFNADLERYGSKHPRLQEDLRLVRTRRMHLAAVEAAVSARAAPEDARTRTPSAEIPTAPAAPPPPGPPASVRLEVKVAAITQGDSGVLGLDWLFGESVSRPNPVSSRASPPDLLPGGNPISPNVRVDSTASEGEVVALRPDQARALMEKLRSLDQVDLLSAPAVATAPDREAKVAVQQVQTIVTGVQTNRPAGSTNAFLTETIPLGLSVTLRPEWLGKSWRIAANGRVTEFLGYDDPGQKGGGAGKRSTEPTVPLPHLAIRELRATGEVRNGSSLLIRGPLTESRVVREEGRVFKKKVETVKRTRLLMIVTPEE